MAPTGRGLVVVQDGAGTDSPWAQRARGRVWGCDSVIAGGQFLEGSAGKEFTSSAGDTGDVVGSPGRENPLEKEVATTPVLLLGKFHGQRNLVGYSPWVAKSWT